MLYVVMPRNLCVDDVYFVFVLFSKIYDFRKNTIFVTLFVGISKQNACGKFQAETINSAKLEPLKILIFLVEDLVSGKQSFSKIKTQSLITEPKK